MSVTMNIFRKISFLFKSFVKMELSYVFTINMFSATKKRTARKSELSYKNRCFLLFVIIYVPPIILIFNINDVVLIVMIC